MYCSNIKKLTLKRKRENKTKYNIYVINLVTFQKTIT